MVNKRGLSPDEYFKLDDEVLEMLMIYDSNIEPSGIEIDMLFHTQKCYQDVINNPNLPVEYKRKVEPNQFDFLEVLDPYSTVKEKRLQRISKEEENQAKEVSNIGDMIKSIALKKGKNNGKQ
ncbi:TPA: hypothetical protein QCK11_004727 [Enterobacter asburiae]|nr:hypothetical protein [Enterobacter asburiae]